MAWWSRNYAAQRITATHFEVAPRTMIGWKEVPLVYLNGKAHATDKNWLAAADRRLKEMLARQNAGEVGVLQSAARAIAGAAETRARKRELGVKLRAPRRPKEELERLRIQRRQRAAVTLST
jgi:hypothetical protein